MTSDLDLVAREAAHFIARWRRQEGSQWGPNLVGIEELAFRKALAKAEHIGLDPYFIVYVVMGVEWLFRVRYLASQEIDAILDVISTWVSRSARDQAANSCRAVREAIGEARFLVSMGVWAIPAPGLPGELLTRRRLAKYAQPERIIVTRRGPIPALSPRLSAIVIEAAAERACGPHKGGTALALEVASVLLKHEVDRGTLNRWAKVLSLAPPESLSRLSNGSPVQDLREWLLFRWEGAYRSAFEDRQRDWAGFLIETAGNPLATFGPMADVDAVSVLYSLPWSQPWRESRGSTDTAQVSRVLQRADAPRLTSPQCPS